MNLVKTDLGLSPKRLSRPGLLNAQDKSYHQILFQQSRPPTDYDLNIAQLIQAERSAGMMRILFNSGFMKATALTYGTPTNVVSLADSQINVSGYLVRIANPTITGKQNQIQLTTPPPSLSPPAAPGVTTSPTGGTVPAGTYQVAVTYVNPYGETTASTAAPITTSGTTSTISIASPVASGNATGWYAYVTQAGGGTFTRQQAGAPTPLGTALTLATTPTTGGGTPPVSNTANVRTDLVWVEVWFEEVIPTQSTDGTKSSSVYQYGGVGYGSYTPANPLVTTDGTNNELIDPTFNAETTRRIQVRWRLKVTEGVNVSSAPKGLADATGSVPNPLTLARGGATTEQAGKTFTRADKLAGFALPDTGLYVAGAGTTADASVLNTADGYVYALPVVLLTRTAGDSNLASNMATDIRDVSIVTAGGGDTTVPGALHVGTSLANTVDVTGATTGNAVTMSVGVASTDTNVDLRLLPKGTGRTRTTQLWLEANGAVNNPAFGWSDGGVYRLGTNDLALTIGGNKLLEWTTTGVAVTGQLQATGNLGAGPVTPAYGLHQLGGATRLQALATPGTPVVGVTGVPGSTTWQYQIVAVDRNGFKTLSSGTGQTSTGNATLSGSNYVTLSWAAVTGAVSYDVLKWNGTTWGLLQTTSATTAIDQGAVLSAYTVPGRNTTADVTIDGLVTATAGLTSTGTLTANATLVANGALTANAGATVTGGTLTASAGAVLNGSVTGSGIGAGATQVAQGNHNHTGLAPAPHAGTHASGGSDQVSLTQAITHGSPDTDSATSSLHHTLGTTATQASTGNHDHSVVKLAQANTHQTPDTDSATGSLHHTIGASGTQAAAGNHSHTGLAPGAHASTHAAGGSDAVSLTQAITHGSADTDTATGSLHHTIGASATQAAAGNHAHSMTGTLAPRAILAADSWLPASSGGATLALVTTGGDKYELQYPNGGASAYRPLVVPSNYNGTAITFKLHWSTPNASQGVTWAMLGYFNAPDTTPDTAPSSLVSGAVTSSATAGAETVSTYAYSTTAGQFAGQPLYLQVQRAAGGSADVARLRAVEIIFG